MAESMVTGGPLITASKVQGNNVYDLAGEKIGSVSDLVIEKVSGRTVYAVISFGGLFGIGAKYHPLPWEALKYNEELGGYGVDVNKERLTNAPSYESSDFEWTPRFRSEVDSYYNVQR